MNILITGATGLIGSALAERLLGNKGYSLYCQSRGAAKNATEVRWILMDLVHDSWGAHNLPNIDVIYHFAGQTSTYSARRDQMQDLEANVISFLRLLMHFKQQDCPPFVVLAGTVTQAGLVESHQIDENIKDRPITFYDISKLTAEMYLSQFVKEGWIRGCTLRLANVYGGGKVGQQSDRGVIDKIFRKALNGENLTIYGDGICLRDYIYIDDVVSAFLLASKSAVNTNGQTYCVGTGLGVTLNDAFYKVASLASSITGKKVQCLKVPSPPGLSPIEFRNSVVDSSAFRKATGWAPLYDLDSGLNTAYR